MASPLFDWRHQNDIHAKPQRDKATESNLPLRLRPLAALRAVFSDGYAVYAFCLAVAVD
jgi:hypothetical protein